MISSRKAEQKSVTKFILAAERLAAAQYLAGLTSGKPREALVKKKVQKCWMDFWSARDQLMGKLR